MSRPRHPLRPRDAVLDDPARRPGRPAGDGSARRRRTGRPMDPDLSGRFLDAVERRLALTGLDDLTVDQLAAELQAGKAGFYRRWSGVLEAGVQVLTQRDLVGAPPVGRSLRADLEALTRSWTTPLSTHEQAAGALLGCREDEVRVALRDVLDRPTERVLREVLQRARARGEAVRATGPSAGAVLVVRATVLTRLARGPLEDRTAAGVARVLTGLLRR